MAADHDTIVAPETGISAEYSVVYWCYSKSGDLLYIGWTGNPALRMKYHKRLSQWFGDVHWVAVSRWMKRYDALLFEASEIAKRGPLHNVMHNVRRAA